MPYTKLPISVASPGLIIILVDQSGSMSDRFLTPQGKNVSKAEFAADAINRCIYEILEGCRSGEKVKDRCHIVVIGYGSQTSVLVAGKASEIDAQSKRTVNVSGLDLPVWVEPAASNGTPMADAFNEAAEVINKWVPYYPNNFPPVVINVTDGEPNNEASAIDAARNLMSLGTQDGTTLLFNGHIGTSSSGEILLPATDSTFTDKLARLMFSISSELPSPMAAAAQNAGFKPAAGSRGFLMNASAESLTKLLVFGSQHAR